MLHRYNNNNNNNNSSSSMIRELDNRDYDKVKIIQFVFIYFYIIKGI